MISVPETNIARNRYGIEPNTEMDQHFMIDEAVINKMVGLGEIDSYDCILEVGAGYGNLTRKLAERGPQVVYALERDERLAEILRREITRYKNVQVMECDAVETVWPEAEKLIANPPYRISEPLLQKVFRGRFNLAVLTFPKPLVDRLTTSSNDEKYTKLSLMVNSMYNISVECVLPPSTFSPQPRVYSALVRFTPRNAADFETYFVRSLFLQSDKKFKNALREAFIQYCSDIKKTRLTQRESREIISKLDVNPELLELDISQISLKDIQELIASIISTGVML